MSENASLPEMQELAEQIGEFIHYWGFKRVHGRIWTHLFLANRPLDAADLVRQLDISKALISISLRELLDFQVVVEVGKSERGTNLYRTNPDILSVILSVLRQREKRLLSRILSAQEGLNRVVTADKEKSELSQERLDQLSQLITSASFALEGFIAMQSIDFGDWQKTFTLGKNEPHSGPSRESKYNEAAPSKNAASYSTASENRHRIHDEAVLIPGSQKI